MSNINSLLESSASGWKNMQSDAARLAAKWGKTGLLEGLGSEVEKNNMSLILENQAKQLVVESSTNTAGTGGTFSAGTGAQWAGVALPLVRKVFGAISTKEFVSVQPMNLPSGLVFFLDFQYDQTKQLGFGGPGSVFTSPASMYGDTNPGAGVDPSGGLYGAGRFGYSVNQFTTSSTFVTASATWSDVDYISELSASVAAGNLKKVTVTVPTNVDFKGVRAFALSGSTANPAFILPAFTATNGTNNVTFVFASGSGATNGTGTVFYNVQPTDNYRGDFEDQSGTAGGFPNAQSNTELSIPQINVQLKSEAIVAKTRKLKAQWTPEFAQDLNAYQALDAEAELTSIMSEYISLEIDLEILDMLIQDASAADEYWSAISNRSLNAAKTGYDDLGFFNKSGNLNNRFTVYKNPYMTENVILMGYRGSQFLETGAVFSPYIPLIMTPLVYDPETFTPRKGLLTRYAKKMIRPEFYGRVFVSDLASV